MTLILTIALEVHFSPLKYLVIPLAQWKSLVSSFLQKGTKHRPQNAVANQHMEKGIKHPLLGRDLPCRTLYWLPYFDSPNHLYTKLKKGSKISGDCRGLEIAWHTFAAWGRLETQAWLLKLCSLWMLVNNVFLFEGRQFPVLDNNRIKT